MATYPLPLRTKYKIEQAPHQLIGALAHLLNLNLFHLYHQIPQLPPPLETQVLGPHVIFQVLPSFYDSLRFVHSVLIHKQLVAVYLD